MLHSKLLKKVEKGFCGENDGDDEKGWIKWERIERNKRKRETQKGNRVKMRKWKIREQSKQ